MTKQICHAVTKSDYLKSEQYQHFIEECQAILTETEFTARWELIRGYHQLGQRVMEEWGTFERAEIYGEEIIQTIAEALGKMPRTIYRAVQFYKKYSNLDALPEGKNISWHKICNKYLVDSKKKTQSAPIQVSFVGVIKDVDVNKMECTLSHFKAEFDVSNQTLRNAIGNKWVRGKFEVIPYEESDQI